MHSCLVKTLRQLHVMRVTCKTLLGRVHAVGHQGHSPHLP